jgi:hypothetical protein
VQRQGLVSQPPVVTDTRLLVDYQVRNAQSIQLSRKGETIVTTTDFEGSSVKNVHLAGQSGTH